MTTTATTVAMAEEPTGGPVREARTTAVPVTPRARRVVRPLLAPDLLIRSGVVVLVAGFALIALAWGQSAGESQVYRQLPYLLSAGVVGLAMVMVGVALATAGTRIRDADEQRRQMAELAQVLTEVRVALEEGSGS